jgi:uncharacterized protein
MIKCKTRDEIIQRLATRRADLDRLRVTSLRLFGSFARDAANDDSDVDFIVDFDGKATFDGYMSTLILLEDLLGRRVDLATEKALRIELKDRILREAVRVA